MNAPDHTAPHEVRLAYQRGYEKGYDEGFDAGSRDWHPLRNMLLTDPETGEPMFICGAPEPDVLGLTRFKVAGTKDLSDWEQGFVETLVARVEAGQVTQLTDRQVETLERLHGKHFA